MKKLALLILCISVFSLSSSAQNSIKANSAIGHIGEQVVVVDSIYNIRVYNDSTAVADLGGKNKKAELNVVLNFGSNFKFDSATLKTFKKSKIAISGYVVLIADQPAIVITDKQNLSFLSSKINQKWTVMAQLPAKKK